METFLLNLLKTSLLGSLAILAMLVLKPLWRERYRAKTRCWLWLALAVFLLLPIDFSVKNAPVQAAPPKDYTLFVGTDKTAIQSTDNLFGDMAEKSGQSPAAVRDTIIQRPVTNPEQKTTRYIPVTTILFYGYLAGAAAFLLYQGVSYTLFRRTVRRWKRDVARADYAAMLSDTARDLGVSAPEMIVCEAISTPAVTGLLRPRLLLPHERYDVQELRYILRHELCHLKRRDMLLKLVLLAANAMHWFNPVVYLMLRQADEDIELACDSAATDGLELPERAAYSRTLLAAVQSSVRALPATTCFGGTVERLKRRITNVLGAQKKRGLGIVALVLALTLTAGCAVSWGNKNELSDPFGKSYTIADIVYIGVEPDDTFRENAANAELLLRSDAQSMTLTWTDRYKWDCTAAGSFEMTEENFDRYFDGSAFEAADNPAGWQESDMSAAKLRRENANTWCFTTSSPPDGLTDYLCLLQQKDGTLYLAMGYYPDSKQTAPHCFHTLFRLAEKAVPIYASMDDYAAACVEDLKKGTMTYSVSENNEYASRSIEDTIADVRVTRLEQGDSLGNLSPDGTVLELWYFQYEMKPTNEAGAQINIVGGQELTDDGYLNENWTHYLTVLHYTYGEKTGYQIIGTSMSNDGLWYNGCGYGEELKYYLHDFYIDYAGLNEPKMYIPNLVDGLVEDGYGHGNSVEGRLVSGSTYNFCYYYVPITGWACSPGTDYWYSRYDTGSYFSVKKLERGINDAKAEWESTGVTGEKVDTGCWRYVTHEGMSNTIVTLFAGPNNTTYEVEIHWLFDGSSEENQWGWNHDRAVEEEAVILQAMVKHFTINGGIYFTDGSSDSESPADTAFLTDLQLAANGGIESLTLFPAATSSIISPCEPVSTEGSELHVDLSNYGYSSTSEPENISLLNHIRIDLKGDSQSWFESYQGGNVIGYCAENRPTEYYLAFGDFGKYATLYDVILEWYHSAQSGTKPSDASSTTTTNAVSRDSLIKAADSYVDLGGYLWYTAGGKFCRWHEGGSVETVCDLPLDYDTPVSASLSTQDNRILMSYHIGGATMGSFITDLYDTDGKKLSSINGYNAIAISGDIIVMTDHFMPTPNNLSISYDCGKTFTEFGDKDWFYGSALTEDGTYVTSVNSSLEIRDGYVYTTAVYDINHEKSDDPLVTHAVRISIKTGAQEILD
ncbi:M56 family metallopeptidase [Hominicoprocola fusiformis]